MKSILLELAAYHYWANQRLLETIKSLPEELTDQELSSSFSSLRKTLCHLWDVDTVWYQRLKLQEKTTVASAGFSGGISELAGNLLQQDRQLEEWLQKSSEASLEHVFSYYNTKKEFNKIPVYAALVQVFNHGTYHRGQLVTMLHELGITKIPATDFSLFIISRRKPTSHTPLPK